MTYKPFINVIFKYNLSPIVYFIHTLNIYEYTSTYTFWSIFINSRFCTPSIILSGTHYIYIYVHIYYIYKIRVLLIIMLAYTRTTYAGNDG